MEDGLPVIGAGKLYNIKEKRELRACVGPSAQVMEVLGYEFVDTWRLLTTCQVLLEDRDLVPSFNLDRWCLDKSKQVDVLEMLLSIIMEQVQELVELGAEVAVDLEVVLLDMLFLPPSPQQPLHLVFELLALDDLPDSTGELDQGAASGMLH